MITCKVKECKHYTDEKVSGCKEGADIELVDGKAVCKGFEKK